MSSQRTIDFRYAPLKSWTNIGYPDDSYKTLVDERGGLLYEYERDAWRPGIYRFNKTLAFALQTAQQPLRITQQTENARTPIVVTQIDHRDAVLTLRAFAHRHNGDRRTDIVMWHIAPAVGIEEVTTGLWLNASASARRFVLPTGAPGHTVYTIDEAAYTALLRGFNLTDTNDFFRREEQLSERLPVGQVAFLSTGHTLQRASSFDFGPASGLRTSPFILRAGESVEGALIIPQNYTIDESVDDDWAADALMEARQFWAGYAVQPLPMQIPDEGIMAMLTACARNMLQARELEEGVPVFQVGATLYRGLWIIDGHFLLEAGQYLGHREDALHGIDVLLRRRRPDGAIERLWHHSKETGIALATLVRQCELVGDLDRMRSLWGIVRDGVAYIQHLRDEAYALDPSAPEYGLLPQAFADGGIGGRRAEYTTAVWTLFGLKEVARMAALIGETADADRFQAMFDSLLADFRRCAARDRQYLPNGTPYLPMAMPGASSEHFWLSDDDRTPPPWYRINPWSALWAYSQAIYPGEILPPDDPLVTDLCRLFEQTEVQGVPKEGGWLPYQGNWNYSASFYAHVWLYVGQPDKAVDYLYAFANHASPTRVWREEQNWSHTHLDQIIGDMPHNWASAELIRLVRHLLVFERGDTLELLPGLPAEWVVPGEPLSIEQTPTRFGSVTLRLTWDEAGTCHIHYERKPGTYQPRQTSLHVGRIGGHAVIFNGQPVARETQTLYI
jgi:hypothetical protein